jgi:hypothetical protein
VHVSGVFTHVLHDRTVVAPGQLTRCSFGADSTALGSRPAGKDAGLLVFLEHVTARGSPRVSP